jgi:hypothetical protein
MLEEVFVQAKLVQEYARQLYEKLGPKAIAEAAQKASIFERSNDREQARAWRRIEEALMHMRGPRAS